MSDGVIIPHQPPCQDSQGSSSTPHEEDDDDDSKSLHSSTTVCCSNVTEFAMITQAKKEAETVLRYFGQYYVRAFRDKGWIISIFRDHRCTVHESHLSDDEFLEQVEAFLRQPHDTWDVPDRRKKDGKADHGVFWD